MTPMLSVLYVVTFLAMAAVAAVILRRHYAGGRFEADLRHDALPLVVPMQRPARSTRGVADRDQTIAA